MPIKTTPEMSATSRKTLMHMPVADIAELDGLFPSSGAGVLKELARSIFVSLRSYPGWREAGDAELSVVLTRGVAVDMGGAQYYIPSNQTREFLAERKAKVLRLLAAGSSYQAVAKETGLSDSQVRKIERSSRRQRMAAATGT